MSMRPPPDLAASHAYHERDGVRLWVHRAWADALPVERMLDGAPAAGWGRPRAHDLRGRSEVSVLETPRGPLLAKAFSRGGVIGGLLRHWYADPSRPAREAAVSEALRGRGCPTPEVVVARARRCAPGLWRLELATAFVPDARDLLAALRAAAGRPAERRNLARAAGHTLRRLHDVGLRHRDLQVKNLLVPPVPRADGLLVVIDLDRCALGVPLATEERIESLARFGRSLVKRGLLPGGGPSDGGLGGVRDFLRAYGAIDGLRRARLLGEVTRRVTRSVRSHRWLWRAAEDSRPA